MTKTNTAPALKLVGGATKAAAEAALTKVIKSIETRGKSLQRDIHVAAVSTLQHAELHGDITLAIKLIDALPDMTRKNAVRDWFVAFGKFMADEKGKTLVFARDKVTMLAEASKTPFWEFKPEPAWQPFNFDKAVKAIIKKAETGAKEHGETLDPRIERLRALLAAE